MRRIRRITLVRGQFYKWHTSVVCLLPINGLISSQNKHPQKGQTDNEWEDAVGSSGRQSDPSSVRSTNTVPRSPNDNKWPASRSISSPGPTPPPVSLPSSAVAGDSLTLLRTDFKGTSSPHQYSSFTVNHRSRTFQDSLRQHSDPRWSNETINKPNGTVSCFISNTLRHLAVLKWKV